MKKWAVGSINFFDNQLIIKIVEADNWRLALQKAFPGDWSWLPDSLQEAKEKCFNADQMIEVVEIKP